jgi:polysaccharide export outer membrane protein
VIKSILWYTFLILLTLSFSAAAAGRSEYILRPGDVISIRVVEHDEFSQKSRIRPDGMINYPVIGEIEVSGLTTEQLVKIMEEKLAPYINNVVVTIGIEQYFANKIYVIGDIGRPGEIHIFEPIDVLKALAVAGGLKNAKARFLKIVRSNGDIVLVDLKRVLEQKGATQEESCLLYPGDTLFVPEKFTIPWQFYILILSALNLTFIVVFRFVSLGG